MFATWDRGGPTVSPCPQRTPFKGIRTSKRALVLGMWHSSLTLSHCHCRTRQRVAAAHRLVRAAEPQPPQRCRMFRRCPSRCIFVASLKLATVSI